ncbi:hypothetical protein H6F42_03440 [Pseudanabaena sp. FACHB-1998]|uniref:hypothetical protein n=1 Tax=Pseudanabaena sp. FACHB-1998 TaxID=2692858 RepID=UPI0016819DC5|nr:hypothetical protein [Pseudanabaena sp. FACHB-1998]MBD2175973.1 hypothetical protein [Pseudanabaena sp. FACHB-1998]
MQIKEITTEQFCLLVSEVMMEVLEEYIDLDEDKKLKTAVVERLLQQQHQSTVILASQAMQSVGLNWD